MKISLNAGRLGVWLLMALLLACAAVACGEEAPRKAVYLTFDDGPKEDTPELIALLEELDVPATFFFVGAKVKAFPEQGRLVHEKGYAIGCHTNYHEYSRLKKETGYVERDYQGFLKVMREYVDADFTTDLYRFPGGSTSYPARRRRAVVDMGCAWFDWNSLTGDTYSGVDAQDIFDLVVKEAGDDEVVILLAHEGKKHTREALPQIVAHFRERGYEFRMLSTGAEDRELLARCPANMGLPETAQTQEE